jgi:hypothetical protein
VTIRTLTNSDNRSIVAFGPECPCISLDDCDIAGSSGLMIPAIVPVDSHCTLHAQSPTVHYAEFARLCQQMAHGSCLGIAAYTQLCTLR